MHKTNIFLQDYKSLLDSHIGLLCGLLSDKEMLSTIHEYQLRQKSEQEESLNAFTMVSDLYYRENFHSDVIKTFLDPTEKHNEGNKFLFAFIDFLNQDFKKNILKENYKDAIAVREEGKIDILVKSEASHHCIIIENKMYNAGDMSRQLPRYYDSMSEQGYEVDTIVYLPLDVNKTPDQSTWEDGDAEHVLPLLCICPAYHEHHFNLMDDWIIPCTNITQNINNISILRQYSELIKTLSDNIMDSVIMNKFHTKLMEGDNYETAISIKNMMEDLPVNMADRLVEKYKKDSDFYKVWKYKPTFCGLAFYINKEEYKIDIWTSIEGYSINLFSQTSKEKGMDWAKNLASLKSFTFNEGCFNCVFTFKEEEKVVECVNQLIEEIRPFV